MTEAACEPIVGQEFGLFLFATTEGLINEAVSGGMSGFVVDWESKTKDERQAGFDTQINCDTVEDLVRVRALTRARILCRLNQYVDERTRCDEIEAAVDAGADEILLPMIRTVEEVDAALAHTRARCGVGILIETKDAVALAAELGQLRLARIYIGLNDLAIDRSKATIFDSLEDGTVDYVRQFVKVPFGVAGLTLPDRGYPIPCCLLISEMARLRCVFTFLRRSFLADTKCKDIPGGIRRIRQAVALAFQSSEEEKAANRCEIKRLIRNCPPFFGTHRKSCSERTTDV